MLRECDFTSVGVVRSVLEFSGQGGEGNERVVGEESDDEFGCYVRFFCSLYFSKLFFCWY